MTNVSRIVVILAATAALSLGGCEAKKPNTSNNPRAAALKNLPAPIENADRIALLVPQQAVVNLDKQPGVDGVVAQVMLLRDFGKGPKTVLVTGEVDLMVFEGSIPKNINNAPKPFLARTFTARELAGRVVGQYNTLWGYSLQAKWTSRPRSANIWIMARYRPPEGSAIYSSPAEQRMPAKPVGVN